MKVMSTLRGFWNKARSHIVQLPDILFVAAKELKKRA